jgi:WD40 repeat protein
MCCASSPDGSTIVAGGDPNTIRIWQDGEYPAASIPFYSRVPTVSVISRNGTLLAVCCDEGTVSHYHLPDGEKVKEFRAYRRPVSACSISPDGSLLALAGWDGTVTLRSFPGGELLRTLRHPAGSVTALSPAGGDGQVLAGTAGGTVHIVSTVNDAPGRTIDLYTPSVRALAAGSDGRILACSGKEPGIRFWDIKTGSLLSACTGLKTTVRCLAFLRDNKTCISGGWDGIVRLWDVPSGTVLKEYRGHTSIISCCAVDPSGEIIVTGSNDTTARIWRIDGTGEPVVLSDAVKEVRCCAISPDTTLLAMAGEEPVLRLSFLPGGSSAGTIPQVPGTPTALAFSSDGLLLAEGYANGTLAFYAVHDRILIRTLQAHAGAVTGIVAIPGGDYVVTGGEDGQVHTFRVPCLRALIHARYDDLVLAQEQSGNSTAMAVQWRFLQRLLSLRFQNEIQLCPVFCNAGIYDIQIVGGC